MSTKIFLLLAFITCFSLAQAQEQQCLLSAGTHQEFKLALNIADGQGKKLKEKTCQIKIVKSKEDLHFELTEDSQSAKTITYYKKEQDFISLSLNDLCKVECRFVPRAAEKLNADANLGDIHFDLSLTVLQHLMIKYKSDEASGEMRGIYFQEGRLLYSKDQRDDAKPWCIFKTQLKMMEDTYINAQTNMPIFSNSIQDTVGNNKVFSYALVDFATGKKGMENSFITPLSLDCRFQGEAFTYGLFKGIVGNYLDLKGRK